MEVQRNTAAALRCEGGWNTNLPPGREIPDYIRELELAEEAYTNTRVYATKVVDHHSLSLFVKFKRKIHDCLGPFAQAFCCVSQEELEEARRDERFLKDVRDVAHLDIYAATTSHGGRSTFSTRLLLEAELAESGHPVNSIDPNPVLFESDPEDDAASSDTSSVISTQVPSHHLGLRGLWDDVTVASEYSDADDVAPNTPQHSPTLTAPTQYTSAPVVSTWQAHHLVDSVQVAEGRLLHPPILPRMSTHMRHSVVTHESQARGLVVRQQLPQEGAARHRRKRRVVNVRQRVVSPVLVASLVAEVISRIGSIRDTPANRLVVERTALLRIRENEDDATDERKWTPEAVAAYLPRVVAAYFNCNVHNDGIGTGARSMWVNFKSWFRLSEELRTSPHVFE
jgi:hypothetical protein